MNIPFSVEQFFQVFVRYNESVWPMQPVLLVLALAVLVALVNPGDRGGKFISFILALFWAWMAIAYHFVFFAEINHAAWLFGALFLVGSFVFVWKGIIGSDLRFHVESNRWTWLGGILIVYALVIYPVLGFLTGHNYPATPTFGLPCPTTIFTIGVLLFAEKPMPRLVFVIPTLWSIIGTSAALNLDVPQDYGLGIAGIVGLIAILLPNRESQPEPQIA